MPTAELGQEDDTAVHERALRLLDRCDDEADHVELRRTARELFPELAPTPASIGAIVGHAATLRARETTQPTRDVTDARLARTPLEPLDYPDAYGDMPADMKATLVAYCEKRLAQGSDGPTALVDLLGLHGWPYSERTFYVGPWKAARLRRRRREEKGDR